MEELVNVADSILEYTDQQIHPHNCECGTCQGLDKGIVNDTLKVKGLMIMMTSYLNSQWLISS